MFFRAHRSLILLLVVALGSAARLAAIDDSPEGEAARLYSRANDYVQNIPEKDYSYAYIQFYWKRSQANLDRIERVYPETATGQKLQATDAKIGPYPLAYFKERVLARLEVKRIAAFDAVNCAIFLYNLDEQRWDQNRLDAQQSILEVLSRQKRWNEALAFPVRDQDRDLKLATIFRVAARYEQKKIIESLLANAKPNQLPLLWPILGEAMALNGVPREEIAKFLDQHSDNGVKFAVLSGMVHREISIQRAATLKKDVKNGVQETHDSVLKVKVRDDVDSVAKQFFPEPNAEVENLLGAYHAAVGEKPSDEANLAVHLAYLEYLSAVGRVDGLANYVGGLRIHGKDRRATEVKLIELYAANGREDEAHLIVEKLGSEDSDAVTRADIQGQMDSSEVPLTVREHTFSALAIKDPCVLAQVIMNWSLTPNRAIRGASPWDSIVYKFLPGFDNLPLPKSKEVENASSASKPY